MPNTKAHPRSASPGTRLYSVTEVAELLGCSDMHVYRLIAAGELDAVDIATPGAGRAKTRIREDNLAAYIKRKTRGRIA